MGIDDAAARFVKATQTCSAAFERFGEAIVTSCERAIESAIGPGHKLDGIVWEPSDENGQLTAWVDGQELVAYGPGLLEATEAMVEGMRR